MVKGVKSNGSSNRSVPQGTNNGGINTATFSFNNVTSSNGYYAFNQHQINNQMNNQNGNVVSLTTNNFLGTFKRKDDIYHHLKHNVHQFLPDKRYITMQHLSQIQTGIVKCFKINQVNINKIHSIPGVSDAITLQNLMTTDPLLVPYNFQTPRLNGNAIEREQVELPHLQNSKIVSTIKQDWYNNIQVPAFINWKDDNINNVPSGTMSLNTEVASTMNMAVVRGGSSRAGKKMVRAMQLESMLQQSEEFRNNVAQFTTTTINSRPEQLDIHEYITKGNVRSRTNKIDKLSKQELVNLLLKENNNQFNDLQSLINNQGNASQVEQVSVGNDERSKFIRKYQSIQFKLAGIDQVDSNSLNLETRNQEFLESIETMIDTCIHNQGQSGLETREMSLCNQQMCNLIEQLCR